MITRPEQIKLKQAQAAAGIDDAEYRDTLEAHCKVRSSTDPRFTREQFERMMALFEAIHWSSGRAPCKIFWRPKYWAERCRNGEANRARWVAQRQAPRIHELEEELLETGCSVSYLDAIRAKTARAGRMAYAAALTRTLKSRHANAV